MSALKIEWGEEYYRLPFDVERADKWAMQELVEEIKRMKLPVNIYSVGEPDGDGEGWCIHREDGIWIVYHTERGRRSGCAIFTDPFNAVNYFIWQQVGSPNGDNSSVGRLPRSR